MDPMLSNGSRGTLMPYNDQNALTVFYAAPLKVERA